MSDEAEKKREEEVQSNYIRILSHQLKSPINSIESLLNTISEGFARETSPKMLYLVEKAVDMAADARELISDLLDYELYSQNQPAILKVLQLRNQISNQSFSTFLA